MNSVKFSVAPSPREYLRTTASECGASSSCKFRRSYRQLTKLTSLNLLLKLCLKQLNELEFAEKFSTLSRAFMDHPVVIYNIYLSIILE